MPLTGHAAPTSTPTLLICPRCEVKVPWDTPSLTLVHLHDQHASCR